MTKIGDIRIIALDVIIEGKRNQKEDYDFGALTLKLEDREYILDTAQTYWSEENGLTKIECDLEKDEDTFEGCKYDLDEVDLLNTDLEAEFYIGGTFTNKIKSMTLFVRYDETDVEINVKQD